MTRVENTPLVGGPTVFLDTGVPWPRTPAEIRHEWLRAAAVVSKMRPGRSWAELPGVERYAFGVWEAAHWSRGEADTSPVRRMPGPVTGQAVRDELAAADAIVEARGEGWEYATGALMWLLWVTGATDRSPHDRV
jgi:hypothetical protein